MSLIHGVLVKEGPEPIRIYLLIVKLVVNILTFIFLNNTILHSNSKKRFKHPAHCSDPPLSPPPLSPPPACSPARHAATATNCIRSIVVNKVDRDIGMVVTVMDKYGKYCEGDDRCETVDGGKWDLYFCCAVSSVVPSLSCRSVVDLTE